MESKSILSPLTHFMILEGLGDHLWEWLKLDIGKANPALDSGKTRQQTFTKYSWKSRLLCSIITTKLESGSPIIKNATAAIALDTFYNACELRRNAPQNDCLRSLPLYAAGNLLQQELTRRPMRYVKTDVERYNRFLASVPQWSNSTRAELQAASLLLWHPQKPAGVPAYNLLRRLYLSASELSKADRYVYDQIHEGKIDVRSRWGYKWAATAASVLEEEGYHEKAKWVEDRIAEHWPDSARLTDQTKAEAASIRAMQRNANHPEEESTRGIPLPPLAYLVRE